MRKTYHKDDLWTESRAMQEMLVDTCQLSVEFSPQSTRVSITGGYVPLNNPHMLINEQNGYIRAFCELLKCTFNSCNLCLLSIH
jgi:hypothetical protein